MTNIGSRSPTFLLATASAGRVDTLLGMNGLRNSEVLDADVDDLTTERGHRLLLVTSKGGKKARCRWHLPPPIRGFRSA